MSYKPPDLSYPRALLESASAAAAKDLDPENMRKLIACTIAARILELFETFNADDDIGEQIAAHREISKILPH